MYRSDAVVSAMYNSTALDMKLFSIYDPKSPPGDNLDKDPMEVKIGMSLTRIIQMVSTRIIQMVSTRIIQMVSNSGERWCSIPPTAVSKLRQFRSSHISLCLSEKTLKAGGPFYLVSMPEEVKYPTHSPNV